MTPAVRAWDLQNLVSTQLCASRLTDRLATSASVPPLTALDRAGHRRFLIEDTRFWRPRQAESEESDKMRQGAPQLEVCPVPEDFAGAAGVWPIGAR